LDLYIDDIDDRKNVIKKKIKNAKIGMLNCNKHSKNN